jgi:ATP/maltotriose-dependent transcriptional regulator MalT/DNA-binding SARP family transcriptional activator
MNRTTIATAKITRPSVEKVFARHRLLRRMDALSERPIVWIVGPPGAGKTVLAASWLSARKLPCLWYQVDGGDADPATFFYYLNLAAKLVFPGRRRPLPLLTPEYLLDVPTFTRRYFEALFEKAVEQAGRSADTRRNGPPGKNGVSFAFVFDNYQDAPADSPIHRILSIGLSTIPPGVHATIISRQDPHPEFARLRASQQVACLGFEEIRFTLEEAEAVLRLGENGSLAEHAIRQLHEQTQGWAAGLILLTESAKSGAGASAEIGKSSREGIFDYFATEVMRQVDAETQAVLIQTALLPQITAAMAESLTGIQRAGEILRALDRLRFFISSYGEGEPTYQYHPLFRDFLLAHGRRSLDPEALSALTERAGAVLAEAALFDEAAAAFLAGRHWAQLVRMLPGRAPVMLAQGRGNVLFSWLSALPRDTCERHPRLLYWMGLCRLPYDLADSRAYLDRAFEWCTKLADPTGALMAAAAALETIVLERGDFSRLDRYVHWIDGGLEDDFGFPSREVELAVVRVMVAAICFRMPRHARCHRWIGRAEELLLGEMDVADRIALGSSLHLYYIYLGDHRAASRVMAALRAAVVPRSLPPLAYIQWCLVEAVHYDMVDAAGDACLEAVNRGRDMSAQSGVHVLDPILLNIGAYGALTAGRPDEAARLLAEMSEWHRPHSYFDLGNYYCCLLCRDLLARNARAARERSLLVLDYMTKSGAVFPIFLAKVGVAHAALAAGDFPAARTALSEARRVVDGIPGFAWETVALFPEALLALRSGNEAEALALLRKGIAIAREHHYLNILYWQPDGIAALCATALEHGIETEYVRVVISARKLEPPAERVASEMWPFPVRIYTLGRFAIIAGERAVTFPGKSQQKPLAMLKAIIALGKEAAPRDQLADALWPDADGDKAHQSFRFTLHQLRRMVGVSDAILTADDQVLLDPRRVWVDAWALHGIADRAIAMAGQRDGWDFQSVADKAITLYQGDFLPGDGRYPWTVPMRQRLKGKVQRLLGVVSERLEEAGRWEEAIQYSEKALEINELQEEFSRRLMRCLHQLGRRAAAADVYQRCRAALSASLDVAPSAETESLYWHIMHPM